MTSRRTFFAAVAFSTLFASAAIVSADEKKGLGGELEQYFGVRKALADDKVDGIKERATQLAKSDDKDTAKAAEQLAKATEIAEARKAFGDLSKALVTRVEAARKKGEKLPEVYVFECTMSPPYGKWLQESKAIGNPYQGSKMPKCGKLLDAKVAEKAKGDCCEGEKAGGEKGEKGCPDGHGGH